MGQISRIQWSNKHDRITLYGEGFEGHIVGAEARMLTGLIEVAFSTFENWKNGEKIRRGEKDVPIQINQTTSLDVLAEARDGETLGGGNAQETSAKEGEKAEEVNAGS